MEQADSVEMQRESNAGGITGKGFLPGQSGNPGGKAKGAVSLTTIIKQKLAEGDRASELIEAYLTKAVQDKDTALLKMILDRNDGPIETKVDVTSLVATMDPAANLSSEQLRQIASIINPDSQPDQE